MGRPTWSQGPMGRPLRSQGVKRPTGSMATIDGSSDHLYSRRGDLEGPIGSTMMLRGPKWGDRGQGGCLGASGWFDESSDNSGGICMPIYKGSRL